MAKAPVVKFPRVQAGFYNVTLDGELVGYVTKKVDGKETTWTVYNTSEPDLTPETLLTSTIVEETELFREAKEIARNYFMNLPAPQEQEVEPEVEAVELQVPDWSEDETEDFFDEANEYEEAEAELVGV